MLGQIDDCIAQENTDELDPQSISPTARYSPNPFHSDNFYYNEKEDYYVCPMGQHMRIIEINHRLKEYKRKAAQRLTSDQGRRHRGRRRIEPEAVFGQMKTDMNYKRFRHLGKDKVAMDFAFFAIAFNIKKMARKTAI